MNNTSERRGVPITLDQLRREDQSRRDQQTWQKLSRSARRPGRA